MVTGMLTRDAALLENVAAHNAECPRRSANDTTARRLSTLPTVSYRFIEHRAHWQIGAADTSTVNPPAAAATTTQTQRRAQTGDAPPEVKRCRAIKSNRE